MSTRASILIIDGADKLYLYHQCDGYPEGIGKDLKQFLDNIDRYDYDIETIVNQLVKGKCNNDMLYRIATGIHGDEEYFYVIHCDTRKLHCFTDKKYYNEVEIT